MEYQVITPEGVEYLKSVTAPDRVFTGMRSNMIMRMTRCRISESMRRMYWWKF